ncbi:Putative transmembrane protein (PGPGW) [Nakamurella panacisegetis]|uniref:Putative transmembrane protein (PGPGW) n=1 Tax=Nakamurella panacisegetis TaxID=1090615 RepID=A0A1H0MSA3_9ACTN|nr:PGPGW domain-containing protein [Nakamurella panacisegetis]SDO83281.1 Putative transmembrane protein (PGPGW) [Nakamurella panacisegetis]
MKRAAVAILGIALLLIGIALLVLPGPGFLLIAAALALLATQFEWAKVPLDYAWGKAQDGIDQVARNRWQTGLSVLSALVLVAIGIVELAGVAVPWVNTLAAITLIISGLILVGTIVYALRRANTPQPDDADRPASGEGLPEAQRRP